MAYAGSGMMICDDCGKYQRYSLKGCGCGKGHQGSEGFEPRCNACGDFGEIPHGEGDMVPCEMCQFTNGLPRPVVVRFAEDMEQRLLENDHKGGWGRESKQHLVNLLTKATTDLMIAMKNNEPMQLITTRCADVANITMMIADNEQNDTWPKNGIVIQNIDTGLYVKVYDFEDSEEYLFKYVDTVAHAERYEDLNQALSVAYHYMEAGRRYRVIDFDNGGIQYVLQPIGWVVETEGVEGMAIPADRSQE